MRGVGATINSPHACDSDKIPTARTNNFIPIWNGNMFPPPLLCGEKIASFFFFFFLRLTPTSSLMDLHVEKLGYVTESISLTEFFVPRGTQIWVPLVF